MCRVRFIREGIEIEAASGTTILEAQIQAGFSADAPCGGRGQCGKCLVRTKAGLVKACQTGIYEDMEVDTLVSPTEQKILTEGLQREIRYDPMLQIQKVKIPPIHPGDNASQWERLLEALRSAGGEDFIDVNPDFSIASTLYERLKQKDTWYVVRCGREILDLWEEERPCYMAAVDIGTTTVVGYLLDQKDGSVKAVESLMNPQTKFGADVIARANYALEHGTKALMECIQEGVDQLLGKLAGKAGISVEDIYQVGMVCNTCMHHLFLGISPASLVHAPYNPAISEGVLLPCAAYGLHLHPKAQILMLPNIAGFVGADTCGCLLTTRQDLGEKITLMIDIGTNGEMVLGNGHKLAACSTAAGPAFEGAKITCGMRGISGAIDHVYYMDGEWCYSTVGNEMARGLCGSGLIDLVALLVEHGYIDEWGKLTSGQEKEDVFYLVPPNEELGHEGVYLTQKDIREVQLAKAAIAAGLKLLMKEVQVAKEQIDQVCIAGAFGNYMDPASACKIGMIPLSLRDKILPIGNAAGEGAKIALLNHREWEDIRKIAAKIDFVELAASSEFQDCFVDELCFGEETGWE